MANKMIDAFLSLAALAAGGVIGFFFGWIQDRALTRNKKLQESGRLRSGWFVMPGSMGRIAILLVVLVAIQIGFPMIFQGNKEWFVSIGVILGYGLTLLKQVKHREAYRP